MNEYIGLTRFNHGFNCMMLDILTTYKILMTRLQIQNRPVSHRVAMWVLEYYRGMNQFLASSPSWGKNYRHWLAKNKDADNVHKMGSQSQSMGRQFVFKLLTSFKRRLQPYWNLLLAFQLANPLSPRHMPDSCRVAAYDFCIRAGMCEIRARAVVEELDEQRGAYSLVSAAEERRVHRNLLCFYFRYHKISIF